MYRKRTDISIEEIKERGKQFASNNDRLGFARYTEKCAVYFQNADKSPELIGQVEIGEECQFKPGTVIGGHGFGFERDADGIPVHLHHFGKVIIGDGVWIGSNCTIDRGTIDDTVIGNNTKIDNLCHIAHNCKIGKNVIICAGVTFCGSVTVEDDVWLAPGTVIKEGVTIGKGATTGLGAVVIKDVPPGALVIGVPAIEKEKMKKRYD